jgi:hypothetical protein
MLYTGHRFVNYRCQANRGSDKDMSSILILKIKRTQKAAHGNYFTGSIHHLERDFAMFPNFMGFFSSLPKEFSWIFFHWWYTMRSNPSTVTVLWLQLCGMLQTRHPCEGAISQWLQWGSERGTGFSARFCPGHCWRLWQTVGRHILTDRWPKTINVEWFLFDLATCTDIHLLSTIEYNARHEFTKAKAPKSAPKVRQAEVPCTCRWFEVSLFCVYQTKVQGVQNQKHSKRLVILGYSWKASGFEFLF